MKDFLGKELNVGDTVVFSVPHYHELGIAHIAKLGKKMVTLDVFRKYGGVFKPMSEATKYDRALCRYPQDCVKVEEEND